MTARHGRTRHALAMVAGASALGLLLAGCGGATTEDEGVPTTVAPLKPSDAASPSEKASTSAASSTSAAASASAQPGATEAPVAAPPTFGQDSTREISEIPSAPNDRTTADNDYLKQLQDGGISTEGLENQLIGMAQDVCMNKEQGGQSYLVQGFGGQLVEQNHTSLPADQAANLITQAAEKAYCS
ncbi:DUF732 domain-containing protein [Corynebacterium aquilae]|uniref:DUF732 domain-containing protein n=1 Tax=Corynebacterium aquilae DSM 44791 TaxID=1431546 RepID=A0A1L7CIE8_9CORY|nr:DUF732 domain-containing protein [Corynebacterium aquilae]APT85624.1 hypothetical protein CAQU_11890 [Corynebacterium aquilae DSM 44791]